MVKSKLPYSTDLLAEIRACMKVSHRASLPTVRKWHREFSKGTGSEATKMTYSTNLAQFCNWAGMDPEKLVSEAKSHKREDPDDNWAEDLVDDFRQYMEDELKYARKTTVTMYGTLRSFFRANGILFVKKTPKQWAVTRIQVPPRGDLVKVRIMASLVGRVAIDILNSLGWRREDVADLTYGDIKADYEAGEERLYVEYRSQKEEVWAGNFISKEGTDSLRTYIEGRKRAGEIITDDSPLLKNPRGSRMRPDDLTRFISALGKAAGVYLTPTHFRKRFRTIAETIVGPAPTKRMGGWKLPGVGEAYYLPPREQTLSLFLQLEGTFALSEKSADPKDAAMAAMRSVARSFNIDPSTIRIECEARGATPEEEIAELEEAIKAARAQEVERMAVAGGTSMQEGLARMFQEVIVGAIKGAKEELANDE